MAERGLDLSYETVRRWVLEFGQALVRNLRRLRPRPSGRWHLDEMVVSIRGQRMIPVASRGYHETGSSWRDVLAWCQCRNPADGSPAARERPCR
jgi:hypothetical protein